MVVILYEMIKKYKNEHSNEGFCTIICVVENYGDSVLEHIKII